MLQSADAYKVNHYQIIKESDQIYYCRD